MPENCVEESSDVCTTPPPTFGTCPRHKLMSSSPPGPHGMPLFGQAFNLDTSHMHIQFMEWQKRHGDFFMFKVLGKHYLVISHPEILRKMFIKCEHARQFNDRPASFMGTYVIKQTKDIIFRNLDEKQSYLKHACMEYIERTLLQEKWFYERWCADMKSVVADLGSKPGCPVNMLQTLDNLATRTIALLLSGKSIHDNDGEFKSLRAFTETGNEMGTVKNQTILTAIPGMRKIPGHLKDLYDTIREERENMRQYFIEENKSSLGLVSMLKKLSESMVEEKAEDWLTGDFILGVIMDCTPAAIVPLQNTLSVLFFALAHHPEVQAKIQHELSTLPSAPTVDDVIKMPYLSACILELKRFHTPLPISARHCTRSGDVKFDKYTIPKNTEILSNLFGIHHDERFWDEPWAFKPERFLTEENTRIPDDHPNMKNFVAMGVGPRSCAGAKFSDYVLALTAASILQKFTLLPVPDRPLPVCDPRTFLPGVVTRAPEFVCSLSPVSNS